MVGFRSSRGLSTIEVACGCQVSKAIRSFQPLENKRDAATLNWVKRCYSIRPGDEDITFERQWTLWF